MTNLYTGLSEMYEETYKAFINYPEEYDFYSKNLLKFNCRSVLEIGCGTGNLAGRFSENDFNYSGMDLSEDMLTIARKNHPSCTFIVGDMRSFKLPAKIESVIITGRTTSYLITNKDVDDTFKSINNSLKDQGILCFDCIDANKFIPQINPGENIIHHATFKGKDIQRHSFWKINYQQSWTFDWYSIFYETATDGTLVKIAEDHSTIRTFSKDEMVLFLTLAGFEIQQIIPRPSYAFDTFVIVARKTKDYNI